MSDCVSADEIGLERAADVLNRGGTVVIPTDTVYGLAAKPTFPAAVERLYTIKQREAGKPIALLSSDRAAVLRYAALPSETAIDALTDRYWPGALTLVLPCADGRSEGFRVPDHDWTRALIARCGGVLRVTSANLSGGEPAKEAAAALATVGLDADLVVDGGPSRGGVASTVIRFAEGKMSLLREGPVPFVTLASGSPRRAKILSKLGIAHDVLVSEACEVAFPSDPERTVLENARAKGAAVRTAFGRRNVLSADTIVWFDNRIYGKPRDLDEARRFLRELSGQTHTVFTGVVFDDVESVERSNVTFRPLDERTIEAYLAAVHPLDRAGAYDINTQGEMLVASFSGEYENVMGLPIAPLRKWGLI